MYKAEVLNRDILSQSLVIHLGNAYEDATERYFQAIERIGEDTVFRSIREGEIVPSIRIPEEAAKALYEAFHKFYGVTEDTKQLRRDYDAERARVDKLIGAIIDVSQGQ